MLVVPDPVFYPESDGQPMAENDIIRLLMECCDEVLRRYFAAEPQVYVSSNLFVYYKEGDPTSRVAPDLFVVKGVEKKLRPNYKIWEEGKAPDVVFEFTTKSSRHDDLGHKKMLYERLQIPEYYVFDPTGEYLSPPFRAFRLKGGAYKELPFKERIPSPALGLDLRIEGFLLRFYPKDSIRPLPLPSELEDQVKELHKRLHEEALKAQQAEERARKAEARARAAEAKSRELARRLKELEANLKQKDSLQE